jgi:hypothetical protein
MALKVERVDTWAATIEDKAGGLREKLVPVAGAGVNLAFVIARRAPDQPGTGVVFVTPVKGTAATRAVRGAGFTKTEQLHTVRIEGPDKRGEVARITEVLAEKRLSLRGLSAAAVNKRFVCHIALDSAADAAKAVRSLKGL